MNIREQVRAALTKKPETAAVETAAVKKPDPQLVLNIAKRFNKLLQPLADKYKLKLLTGKLVRGGAAGYVLPITVESEDAAQDAKLVRFAKSVNRLTNTGPGTSEQDVIKFGDFVAYAATHYLEQYRDKVIIDVMIIRDSDTSTKKPAAKVRGKRGSLANAFNPTKPVRDSTTAKKAELKATAKRIGKAVGAPGAPKGVNKLKAFMKENAIDLKTIKSMLKHL